MARGGVVKHGESLRGRETVEYVAWRAMIARCENPKNKSFKDYGGRGIEVCRKWRVSFEAFLADVGRRPSPSYSIDRIDNMGPYSPGNVRWATRVEQRANRRRPTHCKRGHEYSSENTFIRRNGRRECRMCALAARRRWRNKEKS